MAVAEYAVADLAECPTPLEEWYQESIVSGKEAFCLPAWWATREDHTGSYVIAIVARVDVALGTWCARVGTSRRMPLAADYTIVWEDIARRGARLDRELALALFPFITQSWGW